MKKAISTILVFCLFISVAGYTVPCTLHCMYMNTEMEMCHHGADAEMDCNGRCMTNSFSDTNSVNADAARSNAVLLMQYRVNLLAADTQLDISSPNPLQIETYINPAYSPVPASWITDPQVPPPKILLSV